MADIKAGMLTLPVLVCDEDEWAVAKEWALATVALRRRACMLESLMPYCTTPDADAVRSVVVVQKCARGLLGRGRAAKRRALLAAFMAWRRRLLSARLRALVHKHVLWDHCATVIQTAFRRFRSRWTRPKVSELLRRLSVLESQIREVHQHGRKSRKKRKRCKFA